MLTQIRLRRDTASDWTSNDPTLLEAEIGIETDTKKFKIGDGTTAWTSLAYDYYVYSASIVPSTSGTLDVGSTALPFRDLYLTGSSVYMNGSKVLYMSGNDLVLDSPSGNVVLSGGVDLSNADIQHDALDGLGDDDHTQYLLAAGTRQLTGDWDYGAQTISGTGTVSVGKLYLGTDNDFTLYHNGSNAYIDNSTGSFYLRTVGTENAIVMAPNGAVSLYYDAALKLSTLNTGVSVDGVVNSTTVTTDILTLGGGDPMELFSIDDTLSSNSDVAAVSEKAIKVYVDDKIIDHGGLVGLDDDDHSAIYHTIADITTISGDLQTNIDTKISIDGSDPFTGNIQANASGTLDIGSTATPFKSIYLTGGSLHMDGKVILSTVDDKLVIGGEVLGDSILAADLSYYTSGANIDTVTIEDVNSVFGSTLFINVSFNYNQANADSLSSLPCRGIALESGAGSKLILRRGKIRNDAWSWSGGDVYVSATTSGVLTQTEPSGGEWVQIVGTALSATVVYFDVISNPRASI